MVFNQVKHCSVQEVYIKCLKCKLSVAAEFNFNYLAAFDFLHQKEKHNWLRGWINGLWILLMDLQDHASVIKDYHTNPI